MLSNTFSQIVANAVPEIQYRRAVLTFEGVKSDAIFAYMPPFNIAALLIMLPLKLFLSPHTFHRVNVTFTRTLNLPLLLLISAYERRTLWMADRHRHRRHSPNHHITWAQAVGSAGGIKTKTSHSLWAFLSFWDFSRFSVHGDIAAVFDTEPPESVLAAIAEEDDAPEGIGKFLLEDLHKQVNDDHPPVNPTSSRSRRGSSALVSDPEETARRVAGRSTRPEAKPSRMRRESQTTASLRREFVDSGDESQDSESHTRLHRKVTRGERMDSIIDYSGDGDASMQEANARLHKLEEGMKRLESLLLQILDPNTGSEQEAVEGQQEVEREAESGILE
jgi:hypothetical protein